MLASKHIIFPTREPGQTEIHTSTHSFACMFDKDAITHKTVCIERKICVASMYFFTHSHKSQKLNQKTHLHAKKAQNFSLEREILKAVCRPGIWRNVALRLVSLSLADPLLDISHMVTGWQRLHDTGHWMLAGETARSKQAGVAVSPSAPTEVVALCPSVQAGCLRTCSDSFFWSPSGLTAFKSVLFLNVCKLL